MHPQATPPQPREAALTEHYAAILKLLPVDTQSPGLRKTPQRMARSLLELTEGYHQDLSSIIKDACFPCANPGMVTLTHIPFSSLCEHHLLPFYGHCHIAYLPNKKVLGLSKLPRLVQHFSRRLQIQEGLTHAIADALSEHTQARGVAVSMVAEHTCMSIRGIGSRGTQTHTEAWLGAMRAPEQRRAFEQRLLHAQTRAP